MARRSRAREVALQALYQEDVNPATTPADIEDFVRGRMDAPDLQDFALSLVSGVRRHRVEVDQILTRTADNWTLGRMAATDRNVLRLGAFELLHTDTPHAVIIDEAVELAKRFGGKQSAQFVNGVLDRVLSHREKPGESAP